MRALSQKLGSQNTFPNRPVWAVFSSNGSSPGSQLVAWYGADNPFNPMAFESSSSGSTSRLLGGRNIQDEVAGTYYLSGTSASTSSTFAPNSGGIGVNCFGQTACLANVDFNAYGDWGFYNATQAFEIVSNSGVVVGEKSWNQLFDLLAINGKVGLQAAGGFSEAFKSTFQNQSAFYMGNYAAFLGGGTNESAIGGTALITTAATAAAPSNFGSIGYNRNTKRLVYIEKVGTTIGAYQIHVFETGLQISSTTSSYDLKNAVDAAISAGVSGYKTGTLALGSMSYGGSAAAVSSIANLKVIPCDDGTIWVAVLDANDASSATALRFYSVSISGSTFTATSRGSAAANAYGSGYSTAWAYGIRHMNSDDNSRVAVYAPSSGAQGGVAMAVLSTASSGANDWLTLTSPTSISIAPKGGTDFVLANLSANADSGAGTQIAFLDCSRLAGRAVSGFNASVGQYPSVNISTSYFGAIAVKVQPVKEFK